jgi:hypothetical protein
MRRSNSSGDRYWVVDDDGVDAKRLESRNGARSLANEHHGPFVLLLAVSGS